MINKELYNEGIRCKGRCQLCTHDVKNCYQYIVEIKGTKYDIVEIKENKEDIKVKDLEFGYECKDIITGIEGILKTRGIFITGCDRVEIIPKDKEGVWCDVPLLKVLGEGVSKDIEETGQCNKYKDIDEAKYEFGVLAKDKITGYEGKIIAKSISVAGDIAYGLSPKYAKESKDNNANWFDESRIEIINTNKDEIKTEKRIGGAVPSLRCR